MLGLIVPGGLSLLQRDKALTGAASCMPSQCFCEAIRSRPPLQPSNAWSSLAFCVVALIVVGVAHRDRAPSTSAPPHISRIAYSSLFASALMVIGIGSFAFHSRLTLQTQFADVFGMYLIATFVVVYGLRYSKLAITRLVALYIALNAVLATILILAPAARRYLFAVTLLIGIYIEHRNRKLCQTRSEAKYLAAAIALLTVAFVIWVADITRVVCQPNSIILGHAIWHILGALSAWLVFLYYRSPTEPGRQG